jgi:hypothetical protein
VEGPEERNGLTVDDYAATRAADAQVARLEVLRSGGRREHEYAYGEDRGDGSHVRTTSDVSERFRGVTAGGP